MSSSTCSIISPAPSTPSAFDFENYNNNLQSYSSNSVFGLDECKSKGGDDSTNVRVALRIRPASAREVIEGCQSCTNVTDDSPQIIIGQQAFTYDFVFDTDTSQIVIFDKVKPLLDGCLEGYNATILAYGQTGSGKTYTMGTGFDVDLLRDGLCETQGIIPRAVHYIFNKIDMIKKDQLEANKPVSEFKISAQFVELYNEEVFDLFDAASSSKNRGRTVSSSHIKIHEDVRGQIYLHGVIIQDVSSALETLECLKNGALSRTTASTNMNDQSSRSHAIFTLIIHQRRFVNDSYGMSDKMGEEIETIPMVDYEALTAKFHFVDLAGSERLKRTGAEGTRQKEGISINGGLLCLGNVISALGDKAKKALHVPYRDSKLTRLLQDSLGGNSRTLMIACVSPCDRDFVETLNTLKYANRARNIKNKVSINQDKSSRTIALLKLEINQLKSELLEYKQGKRVNDENGDAFSDTYNENLMLHAELNSIKDRLKTLQETIDFLTNKNAELIAEKDMNNLANGNQFGDNPEQSLVFNYVKEIEELKGKLLENSCETSRLKAQMSGMSPGSRPGSSVSPMSISRPNTANANNSLHVSTLLEVAKNDLKNDFQIRDKISRGRTASTNFSEDSEEEGAGVEDENEENTDPDENNVVINQQLIDLNNDISLKQRLIEQLELSQRRLETMKHQYEEKLQLMQNKIKNTEEERDKILSSKSLGKDKAKVVKEDYGKKLKDMESEVKKLQGMQKEHLRSLRDNTKNLRDLEKLKQELDNMKRLKVKLMNQLKEESMKARELDQKRMKEISQLKKEQRKKDIALSKLESDKRMRDMFLKRKHEEVNQLKKMAKFQMAKRIPGGSKMKNSPIKAKNTWFRLNETIKKNLHAKQTQNQFEQELQELHEDRKATKARLEELNGFSVEDPDEIDSLKERLRYLDDRISQVRNSYSEIAETDPFEENSLNALNHEELAYLLNKFCNENLNIMMERENEKRRIEEMELRGKSLEKDIETQKGLIEHLMEKCGDEEFKDEKDLMGPPPPPSINMENRTTKKARRLTSTTQELLMGTKNQDRLLQRRNTYTVEDVPPAVSFQLNSNVNNDSKNQFNKSFINNHSSSSGPASLPIISTRLYNPLAIAESNESELDTTFIIDEPQPTKYYSDMVTNMIPPYTPTMSPNSIRRNQQSQNQQPLNASVSSLSLDANNVFNRLTQAQKTSNNSTNQSFMLQQSNSDTNASIYTVKEGIIRSNKEKPYRSVLPAQHSHSNNPSMIQIQTTHTAQGHSKCVISLHATETKLYSGAKDSLIRIWDLNALKETGSIIFNTNFHSNIQAVQEWSNLLIASSGHLIKVYDLRLVDGNKANPTACIKNLYSSGSPISIPYNSTSQSTLLNPPMNQIPPGESMINSLVVSQSNYQMFSTFNERIRLWDLRKFSTVGLLAGKHNSNIMCLALEDGSKLVSGSKDHYIKVYDLNSTALCDLTPKSLYPPHYDGIESLLIKNNILYSGSRDACIKKWDLTNERNEIIYAANNAHSTWITGLTFSPGESSYLVSSCREGLVKFWSEGHSHSSSLQDSSSSSSSQRSNSSTSPSLGMKEVAKMEAHKGGVHALASNSNLLFTGSSEGTINFWRLKHIYNGNGNGSSNSRSNLHNGTTTENNHNYNNKLSNNINNNNINNNSESD